MGAEERAAKTYCRYAPVIIRNKALSALVDSGNTFRSAISLKMYLLLGLDPSRIRPLPDLKVGTAKSNQSLHVMGETESPLRLQFAHCPTKYTFHPIVIKDLSMSINISGPFLARHKIDHLHSRDEILVQGHRIRMHAQPVKAAEDAAGLAVVAADTTIPAYSCAFMPLHVPQVSCGGMPEGEGIVEGGDSNVLCQDYDIVPATCSITKVKKGGAGFSSAMNPNGSDVTIPAGTQFGTFRLLPDAAAHITPWRVALLGGMGDPEKGTEGERTLKDRLRTAIRRAREEGDAEEEKEVVDPKTWTKQQMWKWMCDNFRLREAPGLWKEEDRKKAEQLLVEFSDTISLNS